MILDFLKERKIPSSFAILDFGSSSVKAVIVEVPSVKDPYKLSIVGIGFENYPSNTLISGLIANVEDFTNTARVALKKASFSCGFNPSYVIVGLSGEFIKSVSAKVRVTRERKEIPVTNQEWERLQKKVNETLILEATTEMVSVTGNSDAEILMIDKKLVYMGADGATVESVIGEKVAEVTLSYLLSFIQENTASLLKGVVKALGKRELFKTSQMLGVLQITHKEGEFLNTIFIDLGGYSTDVAVIIDNSLIGVRTIPFGGRNLVKSPDFVPSLDNEIADVSVDLVNEWLFMLEVALSDFEGIKAYPQKVILYGANSKNKGLKEALDVFPWTKKFPFVDVPEILYLEDVASLLDFEDKTEKMNSFIPSISIAVPFKDYVKDRTK